MQNHAGGGTVVFGTVPPPPPLLLQPQDLGPARTFPKTTQH